MVGTQWGCIVGAVWRCGLPVEERRQRDCMLGGRKGTFRCLCLLPPCHICHAGPRDTPAWVPPSLGCASGRMPSRPMPRVRAVVLGQGAAVELGRWAAHVQHLAAPVGGYRASYAKGESCLLKAASERRELDTAVTCAASQLRLLCCWLLSKLMQNECAQFMQALSQMIEALFPPLGLELDPSNAQLKQGLEDAKAAAASASGFAGAMGGLFSQPEVLARLTTNPQVRCSAVHFSALHFSAVQRSAEHCSAAQFSMHVCVLAGEHLAAQCASRKHSKHNVVFCWPKPNPHPPPHPHARPPTPPHCRRARS